MRKTPTNRPAVLAGLILILGCGPRGPVAPDADGAPTEESLFAADRAFAAETSERRLEGWMSWFADDAARIEMHGRIVRGLDEIREYDRAVHDDPTLQLLWEPTDAGLFAGEDHGFTRGRYDLVKDGAVVSQGTYLSIWRREEGRWKVILDTGVPDPAAGGP